MSSLFDISCQLASIQRALENGMETDGDFSALDAALAEELATTEALHEKVDAYCGLIRSFESRGEARKAEAERIHDLAASDIYTAERLKRGLKEALIRLGLTKLETTTNKIRTQKAGGKEALEFEGVVPEEFTVAKITRSPDQERIRAALAAGDDLPWVKVKERPTILVMR